MVINDSQIITFAVDEPIPKFDIPLDEGRRISQFDLNSVYQYTFERALDLVIDTDYETYPYPSRRTAKPIKRAFSVEC